MIPGRNDACHCGSGKKYKKCHLDQDREQASARAPDAPAPLPSSGMERVLSDLGAVIGGGGRRRAQAPTPLEQAQDLMWTAFDEPVRTRRIALAREALALTEDCADAYVVLGQDHASTLEEARDFYLAGLEAGARALGKKAFARDRGHFWGILETRPYMRARHLLALTLRDLGDVREAVAHVKAMLELNPNDNQGVRYLLANWLLEIGDDEGLAALLSQYADDGAATWTFTRAALAFRKAGDTATSRRALEKAVASNVHVVDYLVGRKRMPRALPEYVGFGDENEAISYCADALDAWKGIPGALEWLASAGISGSRPKASSRRKRSASRKG